MKRKIVKRAVLAYSGGLDTSIIVPWLKEHYGCEVVCYCSDVGQGDELRGLEAKARAIGADEVVVEDLRVPFLRDFCFRRCGPARCTRASICSAPRSRARSSRRDRWRARDASAPTRSRTVAPARATIRCASSWRTWRWRPQLAVIAPWREWDIVSREDALAYAAEARHPGPGQTQGDLYSRDANLWHLSHEGGPLEDPERPRPATSIGSPSPGTQWPANARVRDDRIRGRNAGEHERRHARPGRSRDEAERDRRAARRRAASTSSRAGSWA